LKTESIADGVWEQSAEEKIWICKGGSNCRTENIACRTCCWGTEKGKVKGLYKILVRKPEGKKPLRRLMYRWKNNIKMDIQ